jgi:hypothetical protein
VDAQLSPGENLQRLLQGAEPAREGDEAVGQRGHGGLALVHAVDEAHVADARMRELAGGQRAGDDADDLTAVRQHGIGQGAHQADRAPAVHQPQLLADEGAPEAARRVDVFWSRPD